MVKKKANKGKKYYTKPVASVDEPNDISDRFDQNNIYDEIDDFHDNEDKILLSKSYDSERKPQKNEFINVYDVEDSSDDDEEYDEKIIDIQNKFNAIKSKKESDYLFDDIGKNLKSWGKKPSNFYGGENEMQINSDVDENEKDAAQLEEEESMFLQKQQQQHLDDQDFEFDIFKKPIFSSDGVEKLVQHSDNNNLSKSEKMKLVKRNSPELKGIFKELMKKLEYISKSLVPLIDIYPDIKHLKNKLRLYLDYCVNLLFYLALKSSHEDVQNHPILVSIKEYYMEIQNLNQIENKYNPESYINILQKYQENLDTDPNFFNKTKKISLNQDAQDVNLLESDDNIDENKLSLNDGTDRRAIDYTISKNKGLTPRRKKENRNPRVKHRNKYRKALIRRKGQVRPVRRELNNYDGEISGIKMGIIRSRK